MSKIKLSKEFIKSTVKLALNEDLYPSGDITSALINNDKIVTVKLLSNQNAFWFDNNFTVTILSLLIKAEVISPDGYRSSFRANLTVLFINSLLNLIFDT